MIEEPATKRAVAFFDGQNLYRHAKDAFGHHHPNYDPISLFDAICLDKGWENRGVRFYTGTPDARRDPRWHGYWANRLLAMRRAGILVESRPIRYRRQETQVPGGSIETKLVAQEKGVDLRLGLDVARLCWLNHLDVAVIFSQDQDLAEVVAEAKFISREAGRWIKLVSAYPSGPSATNPRGIRGAEWYPMDRAFYDAHLDPRDYRPRR